MRTDRRALIPLTWTLSLALVASLGACDKDKGAASAERGAADDSAKAAAPSEAATDEQVKEFLKDQRKKGCEMLPPAMVAKVLEVEEAKLRQMKIAGCIYSWESDDESQTAEASITTIVVRKDAEAARQFFDNGTKNQTAEEIRAQLGAVMDRAKEHEAIDSDTKEKSVDQLGGMAAAMVPEGGYQYEDVDGVGDAARVLLHDGSLTVLVGNMVFNVRAYKGDAAPPPDPAVVATGDVKKVMEAAKVAEAKWMEQTRDVRKQQAIALAKQIVAGL